MVRVLATVLSFYTKSNFLKFIKFVLICNLSFYSHYWIGQEQFKSHYKETEVRKGDDHKNFIHAFNAFAPAGKVTGQLVYVNYGR